MEMQQLNYKRITLFMLAIWLVIGVVVFTRNYLLQEHGISLDDKVFDAAGRWDVVIAWMAEKIVLVATFFALWLIARPFGAVCGLIGLIEYGYFLIAFIWAYVGLSLLDLADIIGSELWSALSLDIYQVFSFYEPLGEAMEKLWFYLEFFLDPLLDMGLYVFPWLGFLWSFVYMFKYRAARGIAYSDDPADLI